MTASKILQKVGPILLTIFSITLAIHAQSKEPQNAQSSKSEPALSEKAKKGKLIFNDYCYRCHQVDSARAKPLGPMGPELAGIFKREKLIVGKPVTEANIKEVIKTGPTPGMPGFRYTLSDEQIDQVIEYLKVK
jgi:mono/diheme cytochrome c family protein